MFKFLCNFFSHKWNYFVLETPTGKQDVRVCRRCGKVQYWKFVPLLTHESDYVWMTAVGYTEFGASQHVKGFNK